MPNDDNFDAPDGDIILRTLDPPIRDFRAHKLVLSLASPVFKDMFSLPQPPPDPSTVAGVEIVEVADPPNALNLILRMIYPFAPPSFDDNLDTLVECLVIADKYDIKGARARICDVLARSAATQPLRVYAIAFRFGFAKIADSISNHILSAVHLPGIPELPDDFEFVSATAYHKLVRYRANHLEVVVGVIMQTRLKSMCHNCPGSRASMEEVFRLRLTHLVLTGTPVVVSACFRAWVEAFGISADCEESCALKFIHSAISKVDGGSANPYISPPRKKKPLQKGA